MVTIDIGKKISLIRKSKNITQEFLAKKLNKTPQWLSNIERGIRLIGTEDLAKIALDLDLENIELHTLKRSVVKYSSSLLAYK